MGLLIAVVIIAIMIRKRNRTARELAAVERGRELLQRERKTHCVDNDPSGNRAPRSIELLQLQVEVQIGITDYSSANFSLTQ